MLQSVRFQSLKALRDVRIDLGKFTVLVGPNGVGKSTVLDGLHLLLELSSGAGGGGHKLGAAGDILRGRWAMEHILSPDASTLELEVALEGGAFSAVFGADPLGTLTSVSYRRPGGEQLVLPETDNRAPTFFRQMAPRKLSSVVRLRLDPAALARESLAATGVPRLEFDGRGIPTVLAHMAAQRDGSIERVEAELAQIVPNFRKIHTEPTKIRWMVDEPLNIDGQILPRRVEKTGAGVRLYMDFSDAGRVRADNVSEGTVLALGLLTAIHGPQRPRLILADDLERALHVGAQQRLIPIIMQILDDTKGLQIVATTHSPDLVDGLDPASVWVLAPGERGTHAKPLSEHPEAERWRGHLRTGEFWSSAGESWVTGA